MAGIVNETGQLRRVLIGTRTPRTGYGDKSTRGVRYAAGEADGEAGGVSRLSSGAPRAINVCRRRPSGAYWAEGRGKGGFRFADPSYERHFIFSSVLCI